MKGVNTKLNYNQSVTECRDKLVDLCNKWEMDDLDKDTMTLEVDDYFMSTIYSVVKLLDKKKQKKMEIESGFYWRISRYELW